MIQGITFDYWNTLVAENPEAWKLRVDAQTKLLTDSGISRTSADLEAAAQRMWSWFHASWHQNRPADHLAAGTRLANELGLLDHDQSDALAAGFSEIYRRGGDPATMTIAEGVHDTLADLRDRKIRIGIISDVGFTPSVRLREYLAHHDLMGYFDAWTFSDEVGEFKPSPTMFIHAARGLGIDEPAALAHVGDLRRTDVQGAREAGWTAVRYRGLNDDSRPADEVSSSADPVDDAPIVIDHHDELSGALGLS